MNRPNPPIVNRLNSRNVVFFSIYTHAVEENVDLCSLFIFSAVYLLR